MSIGSFDEFRSALAHRYQIEREVGHGGMATVYLARDLKLGRRVALKVLRTEVAQVLGEERFKREIELAAPLTHPNILPFIDSDEAAGRLFYVMPFIEGGTLADRIARGPRPTLTEALEITRQVAAGLSYAHSIGVVHRDIKPANILLATGHAWLSDFGIARMVRDAITDTGERLTDTGLAIGTVEYMPPEQLRGASKVDGRADEYSLACVLFEMLTGHLPSSSPGRPGALRQELRAAGVNLPTPIEAALERALALETDARFPTVAEFGAALEGAVEPRRVRPQRRVAPVVLASSGLILLAVSAALFRPWDSTTCPSVRIADTSSYAVFPFEYESGVAPIGEEQLLADAFRRWRGLRVVDQFQLHEVTGRNSSGPVPLATARTIACKVGVRRVVLGNVSRSPEGDSLRIFARSYDLESRTATLRAEATVRLPVSMAGGRALIDALADSLLFGGHPPKGGPALAGTSVFAARQAFDSGQRALAVWNLLAADTAFRMAVLLDQNYAEANLWLALVRAWRRREPALWQENAQQAASGHALPHGDSLMALALLATAAGDLGRACSTWRSLTRVEARRFAAWYGLSDCLRRDSIVIPDRNSPSRWSFRSSHHEAQRAYLSAIRLLPSILAAPGNTVASLSNDLLYTKSNRHRKGKAASPDTTSFFGTVGWAGESLVVIPVPSRDAADPSRPRAPKPDEAIRRQRALLDTLALTWVTEAPHSVEARLALVEAMALGADPGAVDSARSARKLVHDSVTLGRVIGAEIRTLIQFGVPDRVEYVQLGRALADSLLASPRLRTGLDPGFLAAMAALTGRARVAAGFARQAASEPGWDLPKPLLQAAPGFLLFAAMGGPADSIRVLARQTQEAIARALPEDQRLMRSMEDVGRPVSLAFPAETLPQLYVLRNKGDWLLTLQAAFAGGDRRAVRRWADSSDTRTLVAKGTLTFDTVWPVAALLVAAGDTVRAVELLDANLAGIRFRPFEHFGNAVEIATMIRAMILRSELASRAGDRVEARRWSQCIMTLWGDADSDFTPELERLRRYVR